VFSKSFVLPAAAVLLTAGTALAQVPFFNIDAGANVTYGLPAATFSAATAQAGTWNNVSMAAVQPFPLVDINNMASPITLQVFGATVNYEFPHTGTPAGSDVEKLMEDLQDVGGLGPPPGTTTWQFNNVPAGVYKITVYSWAPDNRTYVTDFNFTGGSGVISCGNASGWPGFIQGTTYIQDTVTLTSTGTISFTATTTVGFGNVNGVQIEPGTAPPTTYCVAKVNSLGCTPSIGFTGSPSATTGSGFVVSASQVINNKSGLLFYGTTGPASTPFQGGTLCVATPIRRTGAVNSGGNPPPNDCSGVYSIDMNAFAQSPGPPTPHPALTVPGTQVNCQFWGRDPGFPAPNNTTLSNALQYLVGP
jgi:hypothetical protein